MKRYNTVKNIINKTLKDDDFILVYGETLCKDISIYDDDRILYLKQDFNISVIIGLAMCTDKRLFLFCSDSDLISNLDVFSQIALSKLKNVVCVILKTKYDEDKSMPSLSNELLSIKGMLFNMGFIVHDYSHFFKKVLSKKVKIYFDRLTGPICVIIKASEGVNKDIEGLNLSIKDNINRFKKTMVGK